MADLRKVSPTVVAVHGEPAILDALTPADAIVHRVAPDEAMVTAAPDAADMLLTTLEKAVVDDPGAVVVDASDGWTAWAIRGPDARLAFSRVSPLVLPAAGTVQGDVLRLPARVAAAADEVVVFVPAGYGAWFQRKLRERCPELGEAQP